MAKKANSRPKISKPATTRGGKVIIKGNVPRMRNPPPSSRKNKNLLEHWL